ncbi:hypothetical protein ABT294_00655 [Nonomuraea sp. NPDC000554]
MNVLLILALAALLASLILAATQKAWPIALLSAGLFLAVLNDAGIIHT